MDAQLLLEQAEELRAKLYDLWIIQLDTPGESAASDEAAARTLIANWLRHDFVGEPREDDRTLPLPHLHETARQG